MPTLDKKLVEKISAACDAYHHDAQTRGKKGFRYDMWHRYATLLSLLDGLLRESGDVKAKDREEFIRAVTGTARSTARRHLQIYERLHLIDQPESVGSWTALYKLSKEVGEAA